MSDAGAAPAILSGDELEAIAGVLHSNGIAMAGPLTADLIAGGRSNLTFALTDGQQRWVLRMPPRTGRTPSAHDVVREFWVTSALDRTPVPVPSPVALCKDESVIGSPFAVSRFVDGQTTQTRAELERLAPATVRALALALVSTLADLHRVDYTAVGLTGLGRPDEYAARQLRRWRGQWQIVGTPNLEPLAARLIERLARSVPTQRLSGVVHGDFRIDNTIVDLRVAEAPRVAAVVDWELSTIGDPVADVAMMCAYRHPVFDLIVGEPSAWTSDLLPSGAELAGLYEAASRSRLSDWDFHRALAYFKIAVIAAGIDHRRRSGSGSGRGFDTAGQSVRTYLELGLSTIDRTDGNDS